MVDIHTHVLPGLDDGAETLETSLEMLRVAAAAGTTDLVASPHANHEFRFDPVAADAKLAELAAASDHSLRLHRGCDFHLSFENIEDALRNPRKYTIAGGPYLLVEFPDVLIPRGIEGVFGRMIAAGMKPVITHPERNFLLHGRFEQMRAWAAQGCLLQVTAQSFLGRFGAEVRSCAEKLMRAGLVHVVASDAHDPEDRPPRLDTAYAHVAARWGHARAGALFVTNPAAIVAGEPLPDPAPEPTPPPRRKWYKSW